MISNGLATIDGPRPGVDLGGISPEEILDKAETLTMIPHTVVLRAMARVQKTGVLERLAQWRHEDGADASLGGRPILIDDLALLTALMVLASEKKFLLVTELQKLFQKRLAPVSRRLLGLPDAAETFLGVLVEEKRWYNNAHNAFHRIVSCMNPYPYDLRSAKNHVTIKRIVDNHDHVRATQVKARLDEFTERFLLMTFAEQPRSLRRASQTISVSFDQTFVESPTRRAYSRANLNAKAAEEAAMNDQSQLTPGPVDVSAGFYIKSGGKRGDDVPGTTTPFDVLGANRSVKTTEYQVGYAANIAIRVDHESPSAGRFPHLAVAATLSVPNVGASEEAVSLLTSVAKTGLKPGLADADKEYFANALFGRLHDHVVELGFSPSSDYRKDREYRAPAAGGALYINDGVFCPGTPKVLQTVTKDHLGGLIDKETFQLRIKERLAFRLIQKEKPDARGKVPMMCPALGASPTVVCPIREMMKTAAKKARPEVDEQDIPAELDRICKQHSVSFENSDIQRRAQGLVYGSEEWDKFHHYARNGVESVNAQVKKSGTADMETGSRRRVRGLAAAQVFSTFLLTQHNLGRIADFLKQSFKDAAEILVRRASPLVRRRDREFRNAYTGTSPSHSIAIITPALDQPPLTT